MTESPNADILTRCPECETRFRLQETQLQSAGGLVRCGVCMHIFNATQGLGNAASDDTDHELTDSTSKDQDQDQDKSPPIAATPAPEQTEATIPDAAPFVVDPETLISDQSISEASSVQATPSEPAAVEQTDPEPSDTAEIEVEASQPEAEHTPRERSPLELLHSLNTHDHDFEHHQPQRHYRRGLWLLLIALAALVLIGQLLLWQQQTLLNTPAGKQVLELCEAKSWPCETWFQRLSRTQQIEPAPVQQLQSKNLLVRKHPDQAHALLVDVLIINTGRDAVPFPNLFLQFSNLNERELASRIFTPAEYLAGELRGHTQLPPSQPVHVSLAVVDPGPEAVNYRLQLQANPTR